VSSSGSVSRCKIFGCELVSFFVFMDILVHRLRRFSEKCLLSFMNGASYCDVFQTEILCNSSCEPEILLTIIRVCLKLEEDVCTLVISCKIIC